MLSWALIFVAAGFGLLVAGAVASPAPSSFVPTGFARGQQVSVTAHFLMAVGLFVLLIAVPAAVEDPSVVSAIENSLEVLELSWGNVLLAAFVVIGLLGLTLGLSKRIVIFRNFTDLILVFATLMVGLALALAPFLIELKADVYRSWIYWSPAILLLVVISARTLADNRNPLFATLAMFLKIPLSILTIFLFLDVLAPTGSYRDRARKRRNGLVGVLLMAPLILALIEDKKGAFAGRFLRRWT